MTNFTHPHSTLSEPGNLIASIPGLLGYYPQESAIVIALCPADDGTGATLGPVLRVDLGHVHHLQEAVEQLAGVPVVGYVALVVSRIPDSALSGEAVAALFRLRHPDGGNLIAACWHVTGIAAGTPYSLLFGPAENDLIAAGLPCSLVSGTVGSVVSQPTMAGLIAQGALPELAREDTRAYFDPKRGRRSTPTATLGLYRRGEALVAALQTDPARVRAAAERACSLLRAAPPQPLVGGDTRARATDVLPGDGDVEDLAVMLTRTQLRDTLFATALEHPAESATALLAIARYFSGIIRANALSLWAIIAVKLDVSGWACAALDCAQEEVPGHSLSYIVAQLLAEGQHENLLETALDGCREVWEDLGGTPAAS